MRTTRIYVDAPLSVGREISLNASAAAHVARVLRLKAGDALIVFDGSGIQHEAAISNIRGQRVSVRIGAAVPALDEAPARVTLVQGISRGERMDFVVQKATELGVMEIVPVIAARSVVKLDRDQSEKKREHWLSVAISACEQCGRARLPVISSPVTLKEWLAKKTDSSRARLVLDPNGASSLASWSASDAQAPHVELLIGPEGGFDDDELAEARAAGFVGVRLGPRILRTETAAIAALAVVQASWGDLR